MLGYANLENADIRYCDLSGALLFCAYFEGATFENVTFDENTILPDAVEVGWDDSERQIFDKHWTPDTDMSRYTDPNHPDFWKPPYLSPGYQGRKPDWAKNHDD